MATRLSSLIVKIAALCNLNCSYCYVYNHEDQSYLFRPRFMSDELFDATLLRIADYCDRRPGHSMKIVFHGGEPTLLPPDRFDRFATRAREALGARLAGLSIQTNATLLNGRWTDLLLQHGVSVGVSLDGPQDVHDAFRVDHQGRGSYAATMAGIERLRKAGIEPEVLCVVNPAASGAHVYRHFRSEGITWMNFLLPDVSHDTKEQYYGSYGPTPVANFLVPAFDAWLAEDDPNVVVAVFWELLQRLMGGPGIFDTFGNGLMTYLIVETDGSIEALDALRVCEAGIGRSGLNILRHGFDDLELGLPLVNRAVHQGFPLCATCTACEFVGVCGGGYLPHRYSRARGFDNPSVWCEDILVLLRHMKDVIDRAHIA